MNKYLQQFISYFGPTILILLSLVPLEKEKTKIIIIDKPITKVVNIKAEDRIKTKNFWEATPYKTFPEYVNYFQTRAKEFEKLHGVPYELILSKAWTETNAGLKGAGRRTAIFGIKGKGIKGFDRKENQNVEYNGYQYRWQAYSDFCKFVKKDFYVERFNAWKKVNPQKPDWYNYNLALQAHPAKNKGKSAYASCGCESGLDPECKKLRLKHAYKNIRLIEKYIH